ncbi:MAG: hypothetical protein IJ111_13825 [Eggerthellaceae bacterium]|nr:hypothetical protein [Eggerthellaceae bacterium]
MVSERERDDLREAMPEVLSIRCGVTYLRRSFRCPSPAHEDSDPSAHYYEDGHTVHCFGCGKTWDVFQLIGELDGIDSFPDQAKAVADLVGYRLSEDGGPWTRAKPARKPRPLFDAPRTAGGSDCYEAIGRAFGNLYARWRSERSTSLVCLSYSKPVAESIEVSAAAMPANAQHACHGD